MSDDVRCPKCGSVQIHAGKRGWSAMTGLLGSSKIVLTCIRCGKAFAPGEGAGPLGVDDVPPEKPTIVRWLLWGKRGRPS